MKDAFLFQSNYMKLNTLLFLNDKVSIASGSWDSTVGLVIGYMLEAEWSEFES
jgi:hypothetical protein